MASNSVTEWIVFKANYAGRLGCTSGCRSRTHSLFVVSFPFVPHADLLCISSTGEGNLDLGGRASIKWKHFMICWCKAVTFLLELLHCLWYDFRQRTGLIVGKGDKCSPCRPAPPPGRQLGCRAELAIREISPALFLTCQSWKILS